MHHLLAVLGKQLEDKRTLSDCNWRDDVGLTARAQIVVKTPEGETMTLRVEASDTIDRKTSKRDTCSLSSFCCKFAILQFKCLTPWST